MSKARPPSPPARRMRGFEPAAGLVAHRVQKVGETRGFAITRLLTHWDEIAGPEIAPISRPVKVSYGQDGMGATLTLLAASGHAPLIEMAKEQIRARVNAAYGYNAISRVRCTQTAAHGFAEAQAAFAGQAPATPVQPTVSTIAQAAARSIAADVADPGLRRALELLAGNVLTRSDREKG